jgi:hypothetical protein
MEGVDSRFAVELLAQPRNPDNAHRGGSRGAITENWHLNEDAVLSLMVPRTASHWPTD